MSKRKTRYEGPAYCDYQDLFDRITAELENLYHTLWNKRKEAPKFRTMGKQAKAAWMLWKHGSTEYWRSEGECLHYTNQLEERHKNHIMYVRAKYEVDPTDMDEWDDHVDIWNEGELPVGLTPEKLLEQHSSRPQNKNVANAFFKAGFIEAWGRGYKKISEGFKNAGLPMPKTEITDGGVKMTFMRKNANVDAINETTEKTTEKILAAIQRNPYVTTKELATLCGITEDGIYYNTKKLRSKGILRRVGGDKGGYWEILI
jgi:hypothetical protein